MKIILSRKGFDAGNAGIPSPIMPDGALVSMPIPRGGGRCYSYDDLFFRQQSLGSIIRQLEGGSLPFEDEDHKDEAHADPDLDQGRLPREHGWRQVFGQAKQDQTHLKNQGVKEGDLFLFFGWFRSTEIDPEKGLQYLRPYQDIHCIFGWLQVDVFPQVNSQSAKSLPGWVQQHPHVADPDAFHPNNSIYIATEQLSLGGVDLPLPGGGTFPRFSPSLRLTKPGSPNRSEWALPKWFYPEGGRPRLSYHPNLSSWSVESDRVILKSARRGQEFVLDTGFYPEAISWARSLFAPTQGDAEQDREEMNLN
jgi:hypothetical protein